MVLTKAQLKCFSRDIIQLKCSKYILVLVMMIG